MNRYPVPTATKLRALIKEVMQVPAACDVLLGNGSDECIQYITAAVAREGAVVMAPAPSFAMFAMHALFFRLRFVGLPLREDFTLDRAFCGNGQGTAGLVDRVSEQSHRQRVPRRRHRRIIRAAPAGGDRRGHQPFAGRPSCRASPNSRTWWCAVSRSAWPGCGQVMSRGRVDRVRRRSPFNINTCRGGGDQLCDKKCWTRRREGLERCWGSSCACQV
jgi:hypothetical protein